MRRFLLTLTGMLFVSLATAGEVSGTPHASKMLPRVGLSIIRTASSTSLEGLLFSGGSLTTKAQANFSAFLIKHGEDFLLFDTGLGSHVAEQYAQDMPLWARPFFNYDKPVVTARRQLDRAGVSPINTIIISHSHWDHVGGIADFPEATVRAPSAELEVIRHAGDGVGGAWPSQVSSPIIKWKSLDFKPVAYEGFDASLDWFGDGSVVLVPLSGHTPGSVGVFVTVDSKRRYFLVGDTVWRAEALQKGSPKFWAASLLVDKDRNKTQQVIEQIRAVVKRNAGLIVVPSHDAAVQDALGYFPDWVK